MAEKVGRRTRRMFFMFVSQYILGVLHTLIGAMHKAVM